MRSRSQCAKGAQKCWLSLVLVLSLLLGGCAGAGESHDTSAPAEDPVLAVVNGENILYSVFAERMATVEVLYNSLSGTLSEAEIKEKLQSEAENVLETLIQETLLRQKIEEHGLTLTEGEELEAQAAWTAVRDKIAESVARSYPDYSGEDLEALVQIAIEGSSLQEETVVRSARQQILLEKLKTMLTAGLPPVTESAVEAYYHQLLTEQQPQFDADAAAFESAMLGKAAVVYIPHTYRVLYELELRFDDDVRSLLAQLKEYDTEDDDTYETMIDSERTLLGQRAEEIRAKAEAGVSLADLLAEYGGRVNYFSEATTRFSDRYRDIALSLQQPGEIAWELVEQDDGGLLLCWADTLSPGPIPLREVEGTIRGIIENQQRAAAWSEAQNRWWQEAEVTVDQTLLSYA